MYNPILPGEKKLPGYYRRNWLPVAKGEEPYSKREEKFKNNFTTITTQ